MADQTIADHTSATTIIISGEKDVIDKYTQIYRLNGTAIQGQVMTTVGETAPDIDVHSGTEHVLGVLMGWASESDMTSGFSLGVAITDDALVKVLRPTGGRVKIAVVLNRATTVTGEVPIGADLYASTTNDGMVGSDKTLTAATTHEALKLFLGRIAEEVVVGETEAQQVGMWF